MNIKHISIAAVSFVTLFAVGYLFAYANPSFFAPGARTSSATSSPTTITSGAASSTLLVYDAFATGRNFGADSATLLLQMTSSSTASTLNVHVQYSQDGLDWYQNNVDVNFVQTSTTVQTPFDVSVPVVFRITPGTTARTNKAISIQTPTRFVRFVVDGTGANSQVWAEIVPKREIN